MAGAIGAMSTFVCYDVGANNTCTKGFQLLGTQAAPLSVGNGTGHLCCTNEATAASEVKEVALACFSANAGDTLRLPSDSSLYQGSVAYAVGGYCTLPP